MIRTIRDSDSEAVAAIYNHYIADSIITFEESPVTAGEMMERIADVNASNLPWLVAENENGNILGYAYATKWRARTAYRYAVEVTVYLATNAKRQGLGSMLYQALFDQLKQKSIHTVIGGITLPNEASIALHEKFGMVKVAHFKEVGYKFDQLLDVGYWQMNL